MKFEQIKERAKQQFLTDFEHCASQPSISGDNPSFQALLPFLRMVSAERDELREFADKFQNPKPWDWIGCQAKAEGNLWQKMLLKARESGLDIIESWDVRRVSKLIELFPSCVPAQYRGKQLSCYMADNEDCDWMVEVVQPEPSSTSKRPSLRV